MTKAGKFLMLIVLLLGIFFRFANLDQKVYSADEVRSILRLTGSTSEQFVEQVFAGDIVTNTQIQNYQKVMPERTLTDSINAIASVPAHPPLYQLITRFWMQVFNAPISARVSSILFSLIGFACVYWLCIELFKFSLVGWVAITLLAISPFHILVAQNTTQYSLCMVTILLSSAALLKALRVGTKSNWLIYSITLALGFYTHLFFNLIVFGQGIYVVIRERLRLSKNLIAYFLASLGGILMFTPWIWVIVTNVEGLEKNRHPKPTIPEIVRFLISDLGNVFIDFHDQTRSEKYFDFLILILIAYSLYFLCRHTAMKVWLFILILIGLTSTALTVTDLIKPGIGLLRSRYFLPSYLGIQLTVAYLIANSISSTSLKIWQQRLWQLIFVSLISLGVISGVVISQSRDLALDDQKGTASSLNLQLAPVINKAEQPLIISEATHSFVLALSYLVDDKVKYQLVKPDDLAEWEEKINLSEVYNNFSDVFVYVPDKPFLDFLNKDKNFETELVPTSPEGKHKILYRIIPKKSGKQA